MVPLEQCGQEYLDLPWITVIILVEDAQTVLGSFHHRRRYKREKRVCCYEVGHGVFPCGFACNPLLPERRCCVELPVLKIVRWITPKLEYRLILSSGYLLRFTSSFSLQGKDFVGSVATPQEPHRQAVKVRRSRWREGR
jgi:hypothetical protein